MLWFCKYRNEAADRARRRAVGDICYMVQYQLQSIPEKGKQKQTFKITLLKIKNWNLDKCL